VTTQPPESAPDTRLRPPRRAQFVFGLDLGQAQDFTALAGVQLTFPSGEPGDDDREEFALRYLRRWPLGTSYPQVVEDVAAVLASPGAGGPDLRPYLVVDQTGVGAAVVDMFRRAELRAVLRPVLVTAGHQVLLGEDGALHVPKKELVSVLQKLLQTRRLMFAPVPERDLLVKELQNFKVKVTAAGNETFLGDWREGQHDDLVLALGFACYFAHTLSVPFDAPSWGDAPPQIPGALRLFGGRRSGRKVGFFP
jgi:hypothetical protein